MTFGFYSLLAGISLSHTRQPHERRYPSGHWQSRKVNTNKQVLRRRKHRAMRKATRQILRRR